MTNFTDNTDRYKTNFQRIKIPYTHRSGNANLKLSFEDLSVGSQVQFDDARVVKQSIRKQTSHAYFEDFEDIDEGWGPFISSKPSSYTTHLSELHAGYTDDTIDGHFSLKTWREGNGEVYRTSPAMIRFKPNSRYKVQFDYKSTVKGVYRVVVHSAKNNKVLMDSPLDGASSFSGEFTTANYEDYYISITKQGDGIFIIDNFAIDGNLDR
nr:hypothetical protein [Pedobacter sp. ASV19]